MSLLSLVSTTTSDVTSQIVSGTSASSAYSWVGNAQSQCCYTLQFTTTNNITSTAMTGMYMIEYVLFHAAYDSVDISVSWASRTSQGETLRYIGSSLHTSASSTASHYRDLFWVDVNSIGSPLFIRFSQQAGASSTTGIFTRVVELRITLLK
jgi:hypothetical protein